jgi:hypothetical protein
LDEAQEESLSAQAEDGTHWSSYSNKLCL